MKLPTLHQFFRRQIQRGFQTFGIAEPETADYVSEILARFAHTRALYPMRDLDGRTLEHIIDMLQERYRAQNSGLGRRDVGRERMITRHIGEYTLFMSGLFRERVQARGQLNYYFAHGSSAYWQCADGEPNNYRQRVYRRLHYSFAQVSNVLDYVRRKQLPTNQSDSEQMLAAFWRA
jgi:hypothetical protein